MRKIFVCKDSIKDQNLRHKRVVNSSSKRKAILGKVNTKESYLNRESKSCKSKINI